MPPRRGQQASRPNIPSPSQRNIPGPPQRNIPGPPQRNMPRQPQQNASPRAGSNNSPASNSSGSSNDSNDSNDSGQQPPSLVYKSSNFLGSKTLISGNPQSLRNSLGSSLNSSRMSFSASRRYRGSSRGRGRGRGRGGSRGRSRGGSRGRSRGGRRSRSRGGSRGRSRSRGRRGGGGGGRRSRSRGRNSRRLRGGPRGNRETFMKSKNQKYYSRFAPRTPRVKRQPPAKPKKLPIIDEKFVNDQNIATMDTNIHDVAKYILENYAVYVRNLQTQVTTDIAAMKKVTAKNKAKSQKLLAKSKMVKNKIMKKTMLTKAIMTAKVDTKKPKHSIYYKACLMRARVNFELGFYNDAIFDAQQASKAVFTLRMSKLIINSNMRLANQSLKERKPKFKRAMMFAERAEVEMHRHDIAACQKENNENLSSFKNRIEAFRKKCKKAEEEYEKEKKEKENDGEKPKKSDSTKKDIQINNILENCVISNGDFVTGKEIKKGKTVFYERPIAILPVSPLNYCGSCFRNIVSMSVPCPNCSEIIYCSESCYRYASKRWHARICQYSRRLFRATGGLGLMAFQILARCNIGQLIGDLNKSIVDAYSSYGGTDYDQLAYHTMMLTIAHDSINFKYPQNRRLLANTLRLTIAIYGKFVNEKGEKLVKKEQLPDLFVVCFRTLYMLRRSPLTLRDLPILLEKRAFKMGKGVGGYGFGLSLGCEANVVRKMKPSGTIHYKAIRDIEKGEQLFLWSGVNKKLKKKKRQNYMRRRFHELCGCCLCVDGKSKIVPRQKKPKEPKPGEGEQDINTPAKGRFAQGRPGAKGAKVDAPK